MKSLSFIFILILYNFLIYSNAENQPSGFMNFSKINNLYKSLKIENYKNLNILSKNKFIIYPKSYNVLRISSGMLIDESMRYSTIQSRMRKLKSNNTYNPKI